MEREKKNSFCFPSILNMDNHRNMFIQNGDFPRSFSENHLSRLPIHSLQSSNASSSDESVPVHMWGRLIKHALDAEGGNLNDTGGNKSSNIPSNCPNPIKLEQLHNNLHQFQSLTHSQCSPLASPLNFVKTELNPIQNTNNLAGNSIQQYPIGLHTFYPQFNPNSQYPEISHYEQQASLIERNFQQHNSLESDLINPIRFVESDPNQLHQHPTTASISQDQRCNKLTDDTFSEVESRMPQGSLNSNFSESIPSPIGSLISTNGRTINARQRSFDSINYSDTNSQITYSPIQSVSSPTDSINNERNTIDPRTYLNTNSIQHDSQHTNQSHDQFNNIPNIQQFAVPPLIFPALNYPQSYYAQIHLLSPTIPISDNHQSTFIYPNPYFNNFPANPYYNAQVPLHQQQQQQPPSAHHNQPNQQNFASNNLQQPTIMITNHFHTNHQQVHPGFFTNTPQNVDDPLNEYQFTNAREPSGQY